MGSQNNFCPDFYQKMAKNSGAIAIDITKKLICVIDESNMPFYLSNKNIQSAEIIIEEETQIGKNKIAELGKYYFFKSTLGETKGILSVLLAKSKESKKIKSLKLKISTTNLTKPNIYLTFLENGTNHHKEKIINDLYDWVTRLETIKN